MHLRIISILVIALAMSAPTFATVTTLNFDNIGPQGTLVGNAYIADPGGPNFVNDTTVLTCPLYNCAGYPFESSPSVAYSPGSGLIDVVWTTGLVSDISFYIDNPVGPTTFTELGPGGIINSGPISLTTYGQSGIVVALTDIGVNELQISGPADFYVIDDLTYHTGGGTTPEPGTLVLFGSGLLGAVGVLRRKLM
jgi:hypothetical protein